MPQKDERSFQEEITVRGTELVERVKALIQEGNVRRLIVRRPTGEALVEIPLTAGIGIAGLLTLMAPVLAALGAMAALVADFRVQIERDRPPPKQLEHQEESAGPRVNDDANGETGGNGVEH